MFYRERRITLLQLAGALLAVAVVAGACILALRYRKHETVAILDRWWTCETRVRYDTTSTHIECSSRTTCTDHRGGQECITEQDCQPVTTTVSHTRCMEAAAGHNLPLACPAAPCQMLPGDYLRHYDSYAVSYRTSEEGGEPHIRHFKGELWDIMRPGSIVAIERNVVGVITDAEIKKGD